MGGSQELSAEQWALTQCSYKFIWQLFHPIHEFYAFYSPSPHNWLYLWKHDYEMVEDYQGSTLCPSEYSGYKQQVFNQKCTHALCFCWVCFPLKM